MLNHTHIISYPVAKMIIDYKWYSPITRRTMRDFNVFLEGIKCLNKYWLMKQSGKTPRAEHMLRGCGGGVKRCLMEPVEGLRLKR